MSSASVRGIGRLYFNVARWFSAGNRPRTFLLLISGAVIALSIALSIYGWDYYTFDLVRRPLSPKHLILKPSGTVGLRLGMLGLFGFILVYLYPLRKHWRALGRFGKTQNWFNYHVLLGLTSPLIITFHSAFKEHGFAGMAYWAMVALVGSGLVGRYFYAQIPRNISAAELSVKEMQDLESALLDELRLDRYLEPSEIMQLFHLPDPKEVQSMTAYKALIRMISLDIWRVFRIWSLRRRGAEASRRVVSWGGILPTRNTELERAISLASKHAALSKRILFLSKTHRVFHLWHVVHRPFSLSFAVFVVFHVAVVTWLGYY
jgi:hypothetical protein